MILSNTTKTWKPIIRQSLTQARDFTTLHIEAYHNQINNRKESSALKPPKKSHKLKEKSKENQLFYLKKEERNIYIPSKQAGSRTIRRFKMQVSKTKRKRRTNNKHVSH
jgi:hypothetical protein